MNELINERAVRRMADGLAGSYPSVLAAISSLDPLSLRERADLISAALLEDLPSSYADIAAVFRTALADPSFRGWIIWPVGETVTTAALRDGSTEAFDDALALMAELTSRLTSEFPIRRLLQADPDRAIRIVKEWTNSPDEHVRRLASEGTRHYLPWAIRVPGLLARPAATIPILDGLYRDESDYVRRSVANHLNDLARVHPELVVDTATRWTQQPDAHTAQLVRHALRSLVKKGFPPALQLLGYHPAEVTVSALTLDTQSVTLPGALGFSFTVTNDGPDSATLAIDYAVHYVKSNGTLAPKVFKLTSAVLKPGETQTFSKRHAFRQMTTRVHYAGEHRLEVQVNGVQFGRVPFDVAL
ncbi:DNA alkylation repair protein [Glaciihabitans arcticus]|nr:DNA alkylation repair protein [Glaciihabitans arcticus]